MWMAALVIIYFELEVVREVKGCNKESIRKENATLAHKSSAISRRIKATQRHFIRFAGEDLLKRSEKDRVLIYAIHLSTYEVMI